MALMHLASAFSSQLGGLRAVELPAAELQAILEQVVSDGRSAWPELHIEPEAFVRYLAARVSAVNPIRDAIHSLHVTDLYLAFGCVTGDLRAIAALDDRYISSIFPARRNPRATSGEGDEVAQRLRVRTLVGDGQNPPRIASYTGRGPLRRWLSVAASRLAADVRRAPIPVLDADWAPSPAASDTERTYFNQRYGEEFGKALETALRRLTRQARALLQLHFLENVSVAEIASRQGVTPRTIQRRIAAAEGEIVRNVEAALAARLDLSGAQLQSLLPDVELELVTVLRSFFAATA